uniref:Glutaredoxin domain-containing protein n=1 Tax=Hanusia phi TaxID=3032 RepID=A0A7S0HSA2_9CRYP
MSRALLLTILGMSISSVSSFSFQLPGCSRFALRNVANTHVQTPGMAPVRSPLRLRMQSDDAGRKGPMWNAIDKVVKENKIVLFMKGNKDFPQCGFSNTVVQILNACNAQYETVNVLENELLRQGIKEYSNWPTIPQLYVDGEFLGGCDIAIDMYQSGELVEMIERVMAE